MAASILSMKYRIMADILVVIHFAWILFMLTGFFLTVWSVCKYIIFKVRNRFLDRWLFRTLHCGGILLVVIFPIFGKYCPLTVWEYNLRSQYAPDQIYPGSFIARHIEQWVYPSVPAAAIIIPTIFVAVFTLAAFLICPPGKFKRHK
jgi:hypothetical protein